MAFSTLLENSSLNESLVLLSILRSGISNFGVEIISRTFGDMIYLGVVEDVRSKRILLSLSSSLSVVISSTGVVFLRKLKTM